MIIIMISSSSSNTTIIGIFNLTVTMELVFVWYRTGARRGRRRADQLGVRVSSCLLEGVCICCHYVFSYCVFEWLLTLGGAICHQQLLVEYGLMCFLRHYLSSTADLFCCMIRHF